MNSKLFALGALAAATAPSTTAASAASGKRRARLQLSAMLELKIELPQKDDWPKIDRRIRLLRFALPAEKSLRIITIP